MTSKTISINKLLYGNLLSLEILSIQLGVTVVCARKSVYGLLDDSLDGRVRNIGRCIGLGAVNLIEVILPLLAHGFSIFKIRLVERLHEGRVPTKQVGLS
jgi:hypothetical protein